MTNWAFKACDDLLVQLTGLPVHEWPEDEGIRKKIKDILAQLEEVFAAWAEVLHLLHKVENLEPNECNTLLNLIAEFWDVYIDKSSNGSITIKIHMLHNHV
jgi:hypothetical protein